MTKREAKLRAYEIAATALVAGMSLWEEHDAKPGDDWRKIEAAIRELAAQLYRKAETND